MSENDFRSAFQAIGIIDRIIYGNKEAIVIF